MIPTGKRLGFVPNALDFVKSKQRSESNRRNMKDLTDLGISVEMLDLRRYFGREKELKKRIYRLGGIWVRGGNTFVLRQAMRLSGLDKILKNMKRKDFLYGAIVLEGVF